MKTNRPNSQHRRQSRRGAALIEGVIAISAMVVLFGGVAFFHNLQAKKSETLRNARYQAWAATRPACPERTEGQDQQEVATPQLIRSATLSTPTQTVRSSLNLGCNEEPFPNDDMLVILRKAMSRSTTSLLDPVIDTVKGFFSFRL